MIIKMPLEPTKILLVRRDNIGDLVCTTPALTALRARFRGSEIGVLVNSYNADVLHGNPNVDRIFVYQKLKHANGMWSKLKAVFERAKIVRKLRQWKPDVTVLAKSGYDRHGLNFARLIGAKNIIGFVPDDLNLVTALPDVRLSTPEFADLHEVEAINQLLVPLGVDCTSEQLQVFPDREALVGLENGLPDAIRRIAMHISAREVERRWGVDNFIQLAKYILASRPEVQILLFWSPGKAEDVRHPGDDEAAARLIQAVNSDRLVPLPTQNLTELIAALSLCELFIGADGGAMHLAVALDKKIIAFFENLPGKVNHWAPWRVTHQIIHGPNARKSDVAQIGIQQVQEALKILL